MKFKLSPSLDPKSKPQDGFFTARERRKLLAMGFSLAVVAGLFAWVLIGGKFRIQPPPEADADEAPASAIVTPTLRVDEYARLAHDATLEERALLDTDVLAVALADAKLLSPLHFAPMGGVDLDRSHSERIANAPAEHRGRLYRLRGTVQSMVEYSETEALPAHFRGRLALEDGSPAYFAFLAGVDFEFGVDDFVEIQGFFLEQFAESAGAQWIEGPMVVGPRARRSYPALGPVTQIAREEFQAQTSFDREAQSDELLQYWRLLSFTRDADQSRVDWAAAPELDGALMKALVSDPERFVAAPIRIPPCRVQDISARLQNENPARIEQLTTGWLGSAEWDRVGEPVAVFASLAPRQGLRIGSEVSAAGYFLRMYEYEAVGGRRAAPQFVLTSLTPYVTPKGTALSDVLLVVASSCAALLVLFWYLLRRDNRSSRELEAELVRRRRERREKATAH